MEHPIEGPGWVESAIYAHWYEDDDFQETLRQASEGGEVFDPKLLEGLEIKGKHIRLATVDQAPTSSTNSANVTIRTEGRLGEPSRSSVSLPADDGLPISAIGRPTAGVNAVQRSLEAVGRDEDDDVVSIVAIGLQMASVERQMVTTMKVGNRPSIGRVMDCLKREEEPQMRDLVKCIELMHADAVEIRTAQKPLQVGQVGEFRGKWGDSSQVLGKLDDVLEPCIACPEVEQIRKFVGPETSPSAHVFVMYIFERQVSERCSVINPL